jgi:hypothetical protein
MPMQFPPPILQNLFNTDQQGMLWDPRFKDIPRNPGLTPPTENPRVKERNAELQTIIDNLRKQGKSDREITLQLRQLLNWEAYEQMNKRRQGPPGRNPDMGYLDQMV